MSGTMKDLYLLCGISKQGHVQALQREKIWQEKTSLYVGLMYQVREMHPGMGLRKMYNQFRPEGIGRDAFIALGLEEGFRLSVRANPVRTTYSYKGHRYPNLLTGKRFTDVNQVWSSDITYFALEGRYYYIVLIMDVYSRRIVGYSLADNMRAENNVAALKMALNLRGIQEYENKLIHHSDKGTQYISTDYTNLLEDFGIQVSMCQEVLENAHIERANGIIKNEYLHRWDIKNLKDLKNGLQKAVNNYNERIHNSLKGKTPNQFETFIKDIPNEKRKVLQIFSYQKESKNNPNQIKLFESL
jgi:putative transposase